MLLTVTNRMRRVAAWYCP